MECQNCTNPHRWYVRPAVTGGPYPDSHTAPHYHVCDMHIGWAADKYKGETALISKRNRD